ncbi:DNA/RNA-binding protein Alba-like [Dillenia turbinata]|uniref:DNA/RNA-binding protein Alba-like n=1 Tax=Dillenia turbinata TaxID=194707 RepID=A0AAN8ZGN4_9MAGN
MKVATGENESTIQKKSNKIQVSNTKNPLFFYINLANGYIQQHDEVELSALGMASTTIATIAKILKHNGLAAEKKVLTSTVGIKDENKGRLVQRAKISPLPWEIPCSDELSNNLLFNIEKIIPFEIDIILVGHGSKVKDAHSSGRRERRLWKKETERKHQAQGATDMGIFLFFLPVMKSKG